MGTHPWHTQQGQITPKVGKNSILCKYVAPFIALITWHTTCCYKCNIVCIYFVIQFLNLYSDFQVKHMLCAINLVIL